MAYANIGKQVSSIDGGIADFTSIKNALDLKMAKVKTAVEK